MAKITKIEKVPPKMLVPYGRNAKKHPEEQIEKLKNSIVAFGFLTPCVIDREYNIIAGHGRVQAALELGLETVPCVFVEGLTDDERRAYILVDNRIGELSGWDYEMLGEELENIQLDMSEFGFDTETIDIDTGSIEEPRYTTAVNIPQYEPSDEPVALGECYDVERYNEMIKEIDESGVSREEKEFLRHAAERHVVMSYNKIADYYARASKEMQALMERSALVIVDVDDAIKWGYARLSSYLDEIEEQEKENC